MAKFLTDYPVERNALLYVMSEDGSSKGWRVDLLVEKLSSKVEEKLLLCSCCNGLLRDACICEEEFRCEVCIPDGVAWQPVKMNRTIVNEKMIYCPLKWRGCVWSDTVSTAVHHLEDCLYLPEPCPLGCVSLEGENEVVRMERRHITQHVRNSCLLRELACEFCAGEVKASKMNPHLEDCEEFPLPCPNRCSSEGEDGVRVKRKDLPVHLDQCLLQKVQCPYWDHGCREEMKRRHTDTHEKEFLHIHFKLSMTEMKQKQNQSTQCLQHELDIANEKISVVSKELTVVKEESKLLKRQIADKDLQIATLTKSLFSYTQLPTGRLEWNSKGVKQKINDKDTTYSDPFYVGLYKCQSSIEWDYKNTGNIGVFIHIVKGDFDAKLHWPIRYRRTIVLINQINSEDNLVKSHEITKENLEKYPDSFERPTGIINRGFGLRSVISNTDILEKKYRKQDSLTLHISIEVLPLF